MGATEGRHVLEMLGDLEKVLALELLVGTQALEFRMQILAASYSLATNLGVQALRSKLRNLSQVTSDESVALAEDVKRLQADLKQLKDVRPAAPIRVVLELVRSRGIEFLARDRLLSPDIARAIELVESGEVVRAVETALGEPLL
jgi:histidine ammonia-lyase